MIRIEQIKDHDTLRQAAILLDRENQRLHDKVRDLSLRIAQLEGRDASAAQLQLAFLKELLAAREKALFGDKSERRPNQGSEAGAADSVEKTKARGHGPKSQPKLPIVEREHSLDEADLACPKQPRKNNFAHLGRGLTEPIDPSTTDRLTASPPGAL